MFNGGTHGPRGGPSCAGGVGGIPRAHAPCRYTRAEVSRPIQLLEAQEARSRVPPCGRRSLRLQDRTQIATTGGSLVARSVTVPPLTSTLSSNSPRRPNVREATTVTQTLPPTIAHLFHPRKLDRQVRHGCPHYRRHGRRVFHGHRSPQRTPTPSEAFHRAGLHGGLHICLTCTQNVRHVHRTRVGGQRPIFEDGSKATRSMTKRVVISHIAALFARRRGCCRTRRARHPGRHARCATRPRSLATTPRHAWEAALRPAWKTLASRHTWTRS